VSEKQQREMFFLPWFVDCVNDKMFCFSMGAENKVRKNETNEKTMFVL
jgi:hypothetical protein